MSPPAPLGQVQTRMWVWLRRVRIGARQARTHSARLCRKIRVSAKEMHQKLLLSALQPQLLQAVQVC